MKVRELREALAGVPLDADVDIERWDENCQNGEDCGEYASLISTRIGSVNYNAKTNTVTLKEE